MIKSLKTSSISNSQDHRSMLAGIVPSSEYLIDTALITTNTPSVTFDVSSFAGVYKHLQIVSLAVQAGTDGVGTLRVRINGDSNSANYRSHYLQGNGSVVSSATITSVDYIFGGATGGQITSSLQFGASVIDILDPFSTTKNTTIRSFAGLTSSRPESSVYLNSGLYISANAVNSITVYALGNMIAGSRFSIYGVTA
jgi:hypothetical protein